MILQLNIWLKIVPKFKVTAQAFQILLKLYKNSNTLNLENINLLTSNKVFYYAIWKPWNTANIFHWKISPQAKTGCKFTSCNHEKDRIIEAIFSPIFRLASDQSHCWTSAPFAPRFQQSLFQISNSKKAGSTSCHVFKQFRATDDLLYLLKTSENQRYPDVIREYKRD